MQSKPLSKLYFILNRPKGVKPIVVDDLHRLWNQIHQPLIDAYRWKFDQFRPYLVMG